LDVDSSTTTAEGAQVKRNLLDDGDGSARHLRHSVIVDVSLVDAKVEDIE
jgi:hypothetical protein